VTRPPALPGADTDEVAHDWGVPSLRTDDVRTDDDRGTR
jgi:alpha-methylacyl-CoA racemase